MCGPRYAHGHERPARRHGHAPSSLAMGGRLVSVQRPRVRSSRGQEVTLPLWEDLAGADLLDHRAVDQMLLGVSTRQYARSLEPLPAEVHTSGTSRSAVSRRFVAATTAELDRVLAADLGSLDLVALVIDGLHVGEHVVLIALGIDAQARKHVLGLHEGATENAAACTALLEGLAARGMRTDRSVLVVIDGSKALAKAVRAVFGVRAVLQRCQVHKRRNVVEHLPDGVAEQVGRTISAAYRSNDVRRATRILEGLARQLERRHPAAAASLREGLDETLTIVRLGVGGWLARTLCTTNSIEHINGRIRRIQHNVARWNGGTMVLRWTAAALGEAAKGFRRLRGHGDLRILVTALRAHDATLDRPVDRKGKAA